MSFEQSLAILKARWKLSLLAFVLIVGSTVTVSLLLPRQYTATSSMVVDFKPDPVSALMGSAAVPPGFMATQVEILLSDRVAKRVVRNLKLGENPQVRAQWLEATRGTGNIETWLADTFQKQLDVKPSREAGVISVSYTAPDPAFAAALANAFVQAYLETSVALRVEPARQYSTFFDSRAKEAREALERAQRKLSGFQREKNIIASDERFDVENARLNDLSSQAVMLQGVASDAGSRQAQARGGAGDRMQEVLNNPLIGGLKADLARTESRLQELGARLGDSHPQVLEAQASVAAQRVRIESETRRVTGGVGISDSIARQRSAEVSVALEAQRAQVLRMKAVRDEGAVLMRDVESAQRVFDTVVGRFNQSTLESQATQSNVSVLGEAEPPLEPSSPRVLLNTLVSVLLGALVAVGGALLLELANRRVRSVADVSQALALPMLGVLAGASSRRRKGGGVTPAERRLVGSSRGGAAREPAPAPAPERSQPEHIGLTDAGQPVVLDRSIGDLIAESCRLQPAQVEQIVAHQQATGVRFGEAAIHLRLASTEDVLFALARQYQYPYAAEKERELNPELVMLNAPFSDAAEAFRAIRSQVMKRVFNGGAPRRALAVISPNAGDGKTYFAANLAVALAQLGGRTLLIDADMRGPRQHEVFNLANVAGLAGILSGRTEHQVVHPVPGVPGLFLLPVGNTPPNPLELVERPAFGLLLRELIDKFDHVVVDTPATQYGADAMVIAERCGASLMLVRQDATRLTSVDAIAIELAEGPSQLAGVVMNGHRP